MMALTGHSGMQTAQSMHSSGSITSMLGPSRKQSTGQTSTQSVYLHLMQDSVTTWVMAPLVIGCALQHDGCAGVEKRQLLGYGEGASAVKYLLHCSGAGTSIGVAHVSAADRSHRSADRT